MMHKPEPLNGGLLCDLPTLERELRLEPTYQQHGHAARALVRASDLRVMLMVLRAGTHIPEHQAKETAAIALQSGKVRFELASRVVELQTGQMLVLEAGLRHALTAEQDSAFTLTLGWSGSAPA